MSELRFESEDNLKEWLDTQPRQTAIIIAARSAMRAVPSLRSELNGNIFEKRAHFILPFFRAILITNSARWGIFELATAARSAAHSAKFNSIIPAANSASSAADTVGSATNFATFSASSVASSAKSAARIETWLAVSKDAYSISTTSEPFPALWHGTAPERIMEYWHHLRDALLSAENEDWGVWTDWYEARLRGDPVDIDLERAKALIPDEIWEQGPKVANAEIRRLIDEHAAKKRAEAEEQVSPSPVIGADGKLDAVPTPGIDISDDSPDLPDLLRRQRANIADILDAIATMRGNEFRTAPRTLTRYETEIASNGMRLSIDYLNDRSAIARAEYLSLYRDRFFDTEAGLRRGFLNFFALHKTIQSHYPLDAERRALLESFDDPADCPDPAELKAVIADVTEGLAAAVIAEAVTDDYVGYMGGMMEDIAHITYTPPFAGIAVQAVDPQMADAPSPRMGLAKQLYLKVAAFSGATITRLRNEMKNAPLGTSAVIYTFIGDPAGALFLKALETLRNILWALF